MRIAIFTLGSRGDVQPYVALAKQAVKRGHSAVICTGQTFEKLIKENGVEFVKAENDLMALLKTEEGKDILNNAGKHIMKTMQYMKKVIKPAYRESLDQFWAAAQNADLIIFHPKAFGAADVAFELGIPCISIPLVPITYPIEEFPNLAISPVKSLGKRLNKFTYKIMSLGEKSYLNEINDFRIKTLKRDKRKAGQFTHQRNGADIPVIYPISNALFPDVKSWKDKVFLPGFFFLDSVNQELEQNLKDFIAQGTAPIVISFSSMPLKNPAEFKTKLIKALRETDNRAIVLTGVSGMTFDDNKNILAVSQAPHELLFPHAKGILHHGGVGTMATALKSGRPQLIIPFSVDQPFWANRLSKMGYALTPLYEKTLQVQDLVQSFKDMEKPENIASAKKIKELIEKEHGTDNAIDFIEKYHQDWDSGIN